MARPARRYPLREAGKYLVAREEVVAEIRMHWIVLAKPLAILAAVTASILWIDARAGSDSDGLMRVLWYGWMAVAAWALYKVLEWRRERLIVTDKRIMLFYGFIIRKVAMMPLKKVTDMSYHRTIPGRIFRYGRFVLESAGQDQALSDINFIPDPDANYRAIVSTIFNAGGDPDEDGDEEPEEHEGRGRWLSRWRRPEQRYDEWEEPERWHDGERVDPDDDRWWPSRQSPAPHVLNPHRSLRGTRPEVPQQRTTPPPLPPSESIYRSDDDYPTGELPPYDPTWHPDD